MGSLINFTGNPPASEKQVFTSFVEAFSKINPSLDDLDLVIIKRCMEQDEITAEELEYGFMQAYKDPKRYGKVEWNHIWKHIKAKRDKHNYRRDNNKFRTLAD